MRGLMSFKGKFAEFLAKYSTSTEVRGANGADAGHAFVVGDDQEFNMPPSAETVFEACYGLFAIIVAGPKIYCALSGGPPGWRLRMSVFDREERARQHLDAQGITGSVEAIDDLFAEKYRSGFYKSS